MEQQMYPLRCPICLEKVGYTQGSNGFTKNCPYKNCNRQSPTIK